MSKIGDLERPSPARWVLTWRTAKSVNDIGQIATWDPRYLHANGHGGGNWTRSCCSIDVADLQAGIKAENVSQGRGSTCVTGACPRAGVPVCRSFDNNKKLDE